MRLKSGYKKFRNSKTPQFVIKRLIERISPQSCKIPLIRIGNKNDGGYLVPEKIDHLIGLISPGVGHTISFEEGVLDWFSIPVVCCDGTISLDTENKPNLQFIMKNLGTRKSESTTTLEEMRNICANNSSEVGSFMLQMDIEFAEWKILRRTRRRDLRKFAILVIEFHGFTLIEYFWTYFFFLSPGLKKILRDFVPIHAHPNNGKGKKIIYNFEIPEIIEFTFIRKDIDIWLEQHAVLPHERDEVNVPERRDIAPLKGWPNYFVPSK